MFFRAWCRLLVFPRLVRLHFFPHLVQFPCFLAHCAVCVFSLAWHRLHVYSRMLQVACFPVLGTVSTSSRTWYKFHVFSRMVAGCMFSHAFQRLQVFSHLAQVAVFPDLVQVPCFPALGTGCMFFRAWYILDDFILSVFFFWVTKLVYPYSTGMFPQIKNKVKLSKF